MSTSISRGPSSKLRVRPPSLSTLFAARRSRRAEPSHATAATAFQKSRCAVNPTGSVR